MSNHRHPSRPSRRRFLGLSTASLAGAGLLGVFAGEQQTSAERATIDIGRQVADLRLNDKPFATYNYDTTHAGLYRPFFHPLAGPAGLPITQNGEFPGTLRGHYWHRALFVAHQKVNGVSFCEERQADCGKVVHLEFPRAESGGPLARLVDTLVNLTLHLAVLCGSLRSLRLRV